MTVQLLCTILLQLFFTLCQKAKWSFLLNFDILRKNSDMGLYTIMALSFFIFISTERHTQLSLKFTTVKSSTNSGKVEKSYTKYYRNLKKKNKKAFTEPIPMKFQIMKILYVLLVYVMNSIFTQNVNNFHSDICYRYAKLATFGKN